MRIIGENKLEELKAGQSGFIRILIENSEDLWEIYNIMTIGDKINLCTFRKVQNNKKSEKKKLEITLEIEKIDYSSNSIYIKGKNLSESEVNL